MTRLGPKRPKPNACTRNSPAQINGEPLEIAELHQVPPANRPTRRRLYYPTRMTAGPFRLVTFRHHRGYAILDDRTGAIAYTEAHPISGRPIPALEPDARQALRIAADLD
jgi:hypothetical protein